MPFDKNNTRTRLKLGTRNDFFNCRPKKESPVENWFSFLALSFFILLFLLFVRDNADFRVSASWPFKRASTWTTQLRYFTRATTYALPGSGTSACDSSSDISMSSPNLRCVVLVECFRQRARMRERQCVSWEKRR